MLLVYLPLISILELNICIVIQDLYKKAGTYIRPAKGSKVTTYYSEIAQG